MLFPHWTPPVDTEILLNTQFFLLYPFDGGGNFIHQEMLGTLDDLEIADRIMHKGALKDFGEYPNLDFRRFERWSTIEKDSWINRIYFAASLGHAYALTKEPAIATGLKELLLGFARRYPAPLGKDAIELERRVLYARDHDYNAKGADFDAETEYVWFDFQPASRAINILNACWFLRDSNVFTPDEAQELQSMLLTHIRNIHDKEQGFYPLGADNHQSVRALALLYGCEFFKELLPAEAQTWLKTALPLSKHHIMVDRLPDGMGNDISPSYHFFVTWITRDTLVLLKRLGIQLEGKYLAHAQKSFDVCHLLRQPDGLSTVISDGYPLQMDAFLKTLPPQTQYTGKSSLLSTAKLGIQKEKDAFLLLDCSPLLAQLSHYHGGKQGLTLFLNGTHILADSGCCNYDDTRFATHYKQPFAHSSLLLDGQGDSLLEGRYKWLLAPDCTLSAEGDVLVSTLTSPLPNWKGVTWKRTAQLISSEEAIVTDDVINPHSRKADFPLILHPHIRILQCNEHDAILEGKNGKRFALQSELPWTPGDGIGYLPFQCVPCRKLTIHAQGTHIRNTIRFSSI